MNLRNSILVDNTASETVARTYPDYLSKNIAIVTCNKIACSSELDYYKPLKGLSQRYLTPFLFETNVGAGLPIIDTLRNLIISGDNIREIQAVLSGSLNFVFNTFGEGDSFQKIVEQAKEEGFTETRSTHRSLRSGCDAQDSYSGTGKRLPNRNGRDPVGLFFTGVFPGSHSVEDFISALGQEEEHFQELLHKKPSPEHRLKYVASFKDGKARTGLQYVGPDHPFYELNGSDNIVLFHTDRYPEQPLIIRGAGAGAEVTASGIFADIIRIGHF